MVWSSTSSLSPSTRETVELDRGPSSSASGTGDVAAGLVPAALFFSRSSLVRIVRPRSGPLCQSEPENG
jgi:hypothetical protein